VVDAERSLERFQDCLAIFKFSVFEKSDFANDRDQKFAKSKEQMDFEASKLLQLNFPLLFSILRG
jgi:hypothetical protein